jgi:hypothetical protein
LYARFSHVLFIDAPEFVLAVLSTRHRIAGVKVLLVK